MAGATTGVTTVAGVATGVTTVAGVPTGVTVIAVGVTTGVATVAGVTTVVMAAFITTRVVARITTLVAAGNNDGELEWNNILGERAHDRYQYRGNGKPGHQTFHTFRSSIE